VTGALVLENQEQYQAAGLQPVDPMSVPAIPEPGTISLIALGLVLFGWCRRGRRHRQNHGRAEVPGSASGFHL
jgi:hypothetical protein